MQKVRVFLTAEELIDWVVAAYPKAESDDRTDLEYVAWIVCLLQADYIIDAFTSKDLAALLWEGAIAFKINPMESIQGWLETINADLLEAIKVGDVRLAADNTVAIEVADEYILPDMCSWIAGRLMRS